jgi:hypothetical protein
MNSPNYPPPGGPQGPYGSPPGQPPPPYGQRPPQTPPGGQPYGGPPPQGPPQGQPYGAPPPQGQPYGGPPPQDHPYGAPGGGQGAYGPPGGGGPGGPGGPGGAPPASYPTPPPPPAPVGKKNSTGTIIKIVLGVVVIGVVAVFAIMNWGKSASSSEVGDCIKVNNAATADVEKIDCNDPAATYKVAVTKDETGADCPTPNDFYVSYTETGGKGSDLLLCLTLNAKEGDCFNLGTTSDTKVACTDPKANAKVSKILTGTADPAGCPEGPDNAYVYPEPKLVQCLGAVDGSGTGT